MALAARRGDPTGPAHCSSRLVARAFEHPSDTLALENEEPDRSAPAGAACRARSESESGVTQYACLSSRASVRAGSAETTAFAQAAATKIDDFWDTSPDAQ